MSHTKLRVAPEAAPPTVMSAALRADTSGSGHMLFGMHADLLARDRQRYVDFLSMPQLDDGLRAVGVWMLLAQPLSPTQARDPAYRAEADALLRVVDSMRLEARLALCASLRAAPAVNSARARRLVLRSWLRSPQLPAIVLAHRRAVGASLVHAMGLRQAGLVRRILGKATIARSSKELRILRQEVERWASPHASRVRLFESVGWALRAKPKRWQTPVFAEAAGLSRRPHL